MDIAKKYLINNYYNPINIFRLAWNLQYDKIQFMQNKTNSLFILHKSNHRLHFTEQYHEDKKYYEIEYYKFDKLIEKFRTTEEQTGMEKLKKIIVTIQLIIDGKEITNEL